MSIKAMERNFTGNAIKSRFENKLKQQYLCSPSTCTCTACAFIARAFTARFRTPRTCIYSACVCSDVEQQDKGFAENVNT